MLSLWQTDPLGRAYILKFDCTHVSVDCIASGSHEVLRANLVADVVEAASDTDVNRHKVLEKGTFNLFS